MINEEINKVMKQLSWMTVTDVEAQFGPTELDELAESERRDRHDARANLHQLATDIVIDDKPMPIKDTN